MKKSKYKESFETWKNNTLCRLEVRKSDLELEKDLMKAASEEIEKKENTDKDMEEIYENIDCAVVWDVFVHIWEPEREPTQEEIDLYLDTYSFMLENSEIINKVLKLFFLKKKGGK